MGKKQKKTKVTVFQKFRKTLVQTVKAVTMREWIIIIWTVTKDLIDIVRSLPIRELILIVIAFAFEAYNWYSNIADVVFGIQHKILSLVICIMGFLYIHPALSTFERFFSAPSITFGLYLIGHVYTPLDPNLGAWFIGCAWGFLIGWIATEIKRILD